MPPNADRLIAAMKSFVPWVEIEPRPDPSHVYGRFRGEPARWLAEQINNEWWIDPIYVTTDGIRVLVATNLISGERLVSALQM